MKGKASHPSTQFEPSQRQLFQSNIMTPACHLPLSYSSAYQKTSNSVSRDSLMSHEHNHTRNPSKTRNISPANQPHLNDRYGHNTSGTLINASQVSTNSAYNNSINSINSINMPLSHSVNNSYSGQQLPYKPGNIPKHQNNNQYGISQGNGQIYYPSNRDSFQSKQIKEREREGELSQIYKKMQDLMGKIERMESKLDQHEQVINTSYDGHKNIDIQSIRAIFAHELRGKENVTQAENMQKLSEIDEIKIKLKECTNREDIQRQLMNLDSSIKILINSIKTSITAEISQSQIKMKKKFIEVIATQINEKMDSFQSNFRKQSKIFLQDEFSCKNKEIEALIRQIKEQKQKKQIQFHASQSKQFLGDPILLKLRETLYSLTNVIPGSNILQKNLDSEQKPLEENELMYYMDNEGYLLDKNKYYIVDGRGNQVKLSLHQIGALRKAHVLAEG